MARDPVCGEEVDSLRARAVGIFGARTYYFCSPEHKAEFARNPSTYLRGTGPGAGGEASREPTRTRVSGRRKSGGQVALPSGGEAREPTPSFPVPQPISERPASEPIVLPRSRLGLWLVLLVLAIGALAGAVAAIR